jgi:hypothetical protein
MVPSGEAFLARQHQIVKVEVNLFTFQEEVELDPRHINSRAINSVRRLTPNFTNT